MESQKTMRRPNICERGRGGRSQGEMSFEARTKKTDRASFFRRRTETRVLYSLPCERASPLSLARSPMPIHPAAAVLQSSRFFIAPRPPALDARLSTTLQVLQVLNQVQVSVKVSECTSRVRQAFPGKPFPISQNTLGCSRNKNKGVLRRHISIIDGRKRQPTTPRRAAHA